ncbi:MAG: GNAT family N-acetyltransferase [Flexilinea sp.]|nr:GNAT family N-acetyltransferase [Flexilinea sp.]
MLFIRAFYHSLIDAIQGLPYLPGWEKDIYPAPDVLQTEIGEGNFYFLRDQDRIASGMVVNQKCNEEYRNAKWPEDLKQEQFMVIHMLGVHPDFSGIGFAKEMVRYALKIAKDAGMKAMRLDVLKGNVPAEKLYINLGFSYVDSIPMFYEDTGWTEFELYEIKL